MNTGGLFVPAKLRPARPKAMVRMAMSVDVDEKAWALHELNRGGKRIQRIWVNRNGEMALYEREVGLVTEWPKANPFQVPSYWEYSVGEIRDIADYLRDPDGAKSPDDRPAMPERVFWETYAENLEEKIALRAHRTTSGRYLTVQRS